MTNHTTPDTPWRWDGRVSIMAGTQLIAVLGTDGGPEAIEQRARMIEAAHRASVEAAASTEPRP